MDLISIISPIMITFNYDIRIFFTKMNGLVDNG